MASQELTKADFDLFGITDEVNDPKVEVLSNLSEIACYLKCSVSTARRLIKSSGLPAWNISGGQSGFVFTTKRLLDYWMLQNKLAAIELTQWDGKRQTLIRRVAA